MNARNEYWYNQWLVRNYRWTGTLVPVWNTCCPWLVACDGIGQLGRDPKTGKVFLGIYDRKVQRFIVVYGPSKGRC